MVDYATVADVALRHGMLGLDMYLYATSGTFSEGETLTGGTSGATAEVLSYDSTSKKLVIRWITGKFQPGETVSTTSGSGKVKFAESSLMQDIITAAQEVVDEYTHTKFGDSAISQVDYFDPYEDMTEIWLSQAPVSAISSITFKGSSLGTEDTDYWLYPDIGLIRVKEGKIYPHNPKTLAVTYTWGNSSVPAAVRQAVVELTVGVWEQYQRYKNTGGAMSVGMADFQVKFDRQPVLTDDIRTLLQSHKRVRMRVSV